MKNFFVIFAVFTLMFFLVSCEPDTCRTIDGNMWSPQYTDWVNWETADYHCQVLEECGYDDWRLPTISELRTLIKKCSYTVTDGTCGVTDYCLAESCHDPSCYICTWHDDGRYSRLGSAGVLWSSSEVEGNNFSVWNADFNQGRIFDDSKQYNLRETRCVRKAE